MDIRVVPTGLEYDDVLIREDSTNIFEYEKSVFEFLDECEAQGIEGEIVRVYYCSLVNLAFADPDEDGEFAGFGVLSKDDWGDPVLL